MKAIIGKERKEIEKLRNLTEKNLIDLCIKATDISKGAVIKGDFYSWTKNPFYDWYSKIFDLKIPTENVSLILEKLCKEIKEGHAPKNLLFGPASSPADIENHLGNHNFKVVYQQTGMAIDLKNFDFQSPFKADSIKVIGHEQELEEWLLTVNEAFGKERTAEVFKRLLKEPDIRLYAGYDQNKLVSTTMLYKIDNVAGLYLIGTLTESRGKGFGTLITKKVLADAKAWGCDIGVLQASEMGKRMYSNIGFKEYCQINHWEYSER